MFETRSKYIRKETEDPEHENIEIRLEREAAAEAHEYFRHIPKGHSYRPAYPYPPERIPEDEPVPDFPEPIARYEDVLVKDKYYMEQPDYNRIPT